MSYADDGVDFPTRSRLKKLEFDWSVGDTLYTGNFFFDEVEVVRKFKEAFGTDHKRKGEFIVRVSKYNN